MRIINLFKNLRAKDTKTSTANAVKPEVSKPVDNIKSDTELLATTQGSGNKGHIVDAGGNGVA
jgi:hypothetical protein